MKTPRAKLFMAWSNGPVVLSSLSIHFHVVIVELNTEAKELFQHTVKPLSLVAQQAMVYCTVTD